MGKLDDLYASLATRMNEYRGRFIAPHVPASPAISPQQYELDVKAYCLLCHAALEQYFEDLAIHLMGAATDAWVMQHKPTDALLMLLCRRGSRYQLSEEDSPRTEVTVYDFVRTMAEESKRQFSTDVHNNHGASPNYIRALLIPVGLDFAPGANASNSLCKLSQERGEYAHKGFVSRSLSPEDAEKYASDCLDFARNVRDQAHAKGWA